MEELKRKLKETDGLSKSDIAILEFESNTSIFEEKLKELLNDMVIKKDEEKDLHTSNYKYYTLSTIDYEEIIINDSSMIEKFESLVKK